MTFSEMKTKYDSFGAFTDFITVKEAETIGLITKSHVGIFPHVCTCGSDMIINMARTKLTCCDPRCSVKQGLALSELFSRFNIKGIADATCSDVYKMLHRIHDEKVLKGETGLFETDSFI